MLLRLSILHPSSSISRSLHPFLHRLSSSIFLHLFQSSFHLLITSSITFPRVPAAFQPLPATCDHSPPTTPSPAGQCHRTASKSVHEKVLYHIVPKSSARTMSGLLVLPTLQQKAKEIIAKVIGMFPEIIILSNVQPWLCGC